MSSPCNSTKLSVINGEGSVNPVVAVDEIFFSLERGSNTGLLILRPTSYPLDTWLA